MTTKKRCINCNEYSGKRNVYKKCKEEQPYKASLKGMDPFQRVKIDRNINA